MARKRSGDIYSIIKHHIINIVALILLVFAVLDLIMMKIPRGPFTVPTTQQPCSVTPRKAPVRKKKKKKRKHHRRKYDTASGPQFIM